GALPQREDREHVPLAHPGEDELQVERRHHLLRGQEPAHRLIPRPAIMRLHMPTSTSREGSLQGRARPTEFDPRPLEEEMMNPLVVGDPPKIAERLVELVSVPHRVEVVATAATEDEALAACDKYAIGLAIVDLQLAQGTGFGVIRRLRASAGANPACI